MIRAPFDFPTPFGSQISHDQRRPNGLFNAVILACVLLARFCRRFEHMSQFLRSLSVGECEISLATVPVFLKWRLSTNQTFYRKYFDSWCCRRPMIAHLLQFVREFHRIKLAKDAVKLARQPLSKSVGSIWNDQIFATEARNVIEANRLISFIDDRLTLKYAAPLISEIITRLRFS
jgi:hypothetical protein